MIVDRDDASPELIQLGEFVHNIGEYISKVMSGESLLLAAARGFSPRDILIEVNGNMAIEVLRAAWLHPEWFQAIMQMDRAAFGENQAYETAIAHVSKSMVAAASVSLSLDDPAHELGGSG